MECCMHLVDCKDTDRIVLFSDASWKKFMVSVHQWKYLSSREGEIAKNALAKHAISLVLAQEVLDLPPTTVGYHRACYMRFTDKSKIVRAQKKQERENEASEDVYTSEKEEEEEEPPTKVRLQRVMVSDPDLVYSSHRRSAHLLPRQCIICRKDKKITERFTRKRKTEKLTQCETLTAGKLLLAAEMRKDEQILLHIRGQDLVALEVTYHYSCYQTYTKFLSKKPKEGPERNIYQEGYIQFCKSVVESRVIQNREVLRLKKLLTLFCKCVKDVEGVSIPDYKSWNLKMRLQKTYPFLRFMKSSRSNESDLVFVEDLNAEEVVEEIAPPNCTCMSSESSTDGADTDSDEHLHARGPGERQSSSSDEFRHLYHAAQILRKRITATVIPEIWPPTAKELTMDVASSVVPHELYNFLAWTTGESTELPHNNGRIQVNEGKGKKIVSLCQDILNLAFNGRRLMPKHSMLAMSIRHLSGSAQLIGLLNGLGHCSSHSQVLEHDTALAELQIERGENHIPPNIQPGIPATLVWDNNDFGEETLSGKGTTHNTNGIILQMQHSTDVHVAPSGTMSKQRTRKRSLEPPLTNISCYRRGQRKGPDPCQSDIQLELEDHIHIQNSARLLDDAYFFSKVPDFHEHITPGWTGFNILLQRGKIPAKTRIGYLPVIDASPTDLDTVYTILCRSLAIADKLGLDKIVVVMDQAIYAKAQEIRWKNDEFTQRLVIRMGEFHTAMAFLACIGKRFSDAGFQDIIIESEVVAAGSVAGVVSGHHYNRSIRTHKLLCDALQRLRWQAYLDTLSEYERHAAIELALDLQRAFPSEEFDDHVNSEKFKRLIIDYDSFVNSKKTSKTFSFWSSYIQMVEEVLLFIRATRQGNWNLHLSSIRSILPWFFAYDRINYARYLTAYWLEMCSLKESHPDIHKEFALGHFATQRQEYHGFSQIACDQVIEQTANRDSKTKGGLTGFTLNKGAVHRWTLSQHERAAITRECQEMAGHSTASRVRTDLDRTRIQRDEKDVKSIMETVQNMMNPFDPSLENDKLYHITSGQVASMPVTDDLCDAKEKGELAFATFCQERLMPGGNDVSFHDPIKKMKLKTFKDTAKSTVTKVKGREITLKADRNLFARLILVGSVRKVDVREMLVYNLSPLPASLANNDGTLVKTNKAKLLHFLEGSVTPSPVVEEVPQNAAFVWDAMALIQAMKPQPTFGQFADSVLKVVVGQARLNKSRLVHFVPDRYRTTSIKNAERGRRATGGTQITKIYSPDQKTPKQWLKFLSCGENKENLLQFLFQTWSDCRKEQIGDVTLVVGHREECHAIRLNDSRTGVEVQPIPTLCSTQEEADTRLLLHSAHAASTCGHVIINSPDTDVFVLCVALCMDIGAELYFHTGRGNNTRTIAVRRVFNHFGKDVCASLIGLHCFTGCDTVSALYGIGKVKSAKVLTSTNKHSQTMQRLGTSFQVPPTLIADMEAFTCELYGQKGLTDVNEARYKMFRAGSYNEKSLPPNKDALHKHIHRANYQAAIHKMCLISKPDIPSPESSGWKKEGDSLSIDWTSLPPAPASVLELAHCSCKKTQCTQGRCSCLLNKLPCTDMCTCVQCTNLSVSDGTLEGDTDSIDLDEEV